jgi:hypothetical protein
MPRYTMAEMRAKNKAAGHFFFSRDTMRYFRGDKYATRYDKATETNYLRVTHSDGRASAWWRFDGRTGHLHPVNVGDVPEKLKGRR